MSRLPAWVRSLRPDPATLREDAVAGVPGAIASVPDGMASAVLVGVNPVYGLYASMAGPIGGGLGVSIRLMVVTTTTAAALAAGSTLSGFSGADRPEALFVLSALAGLMMMIAAGVLRWGRFTRFVSVSVLTGFLSGVAVNIILGQLGDLLGSPQKGSPAGVKAFNVVTHPSEMSLTAAAVGISALVLMVVLSRTRIASVASLVALAIPTLLSLGASGLVRVEDSGKIPSGIPTPHLPHLSLLSSLDLIAGAAAVAMIVLVQGTGVAESAPNADGSPSDANRDFIAQGIGNLASGLFRGQPVGGSVGQTALNVTAGGGGAQPLGVDLLRPLDAADPRAVFRRGWGDSDPHACRGADLCGRQLAALWADRDCHPHRPAIAGRVLRDARRDAVPACDRRGRDRRGALAAASGQSGGRRFDRGAAHPRGEREPGVAARRSARPGSSSLPTMPSSSTPTAATCSSAVSGPTCSSSCGTRTASISGTP